MKRFQDVYVSRSERYTLGYDTKDKTNFLSIPVANRMVDYEEYYSLRDQEMNLYQSDETRALKFADECRNRLHDDRLILPPGSDRGSAV